MNLYHLSLISTVIVQFNLFNIHFLKEARWILSALLNRSYLSKKNLHLSNFYDWLNFVRVLGIFQFKTSACNQLQCRLLTDVWILQPVWYLIWIAVLKKTPAISIPQLDLATTAYFLQSKLLVCTLQIKSSLGNDIFYMIQSS
jgi:hypothetical protein